MFRRNCCIGVSCLVAAEADGCSFTVSCEGCGRFSGVMGNVGEKNLGEPTPESPLVTLSLFCETIAGAVNIGFMGNGMGNEAVHFPNSSFTEPFIEIVMSLVVWYIFLNHSC